MDFTDKKNWLIGILILALIASIVMGNIKKKKPDRLLEAYDHNSVNSFKYLMAKTDFDEILNDLKVVYTMDLTPKESQDQEEETEGEGEDAEEVLGVFDEENLLKLSNSFAETMEHLNQINIARGYSDSDELLKDIQSRVTDYSYRLIYQEQEETDYLINKIYLDFEELLMELYQGGVSQEHKLMFEELAANLKEIDVTIKSSVNRQLDPNRIKDFRSEFNRIQPILEEIEGILSRN